MIINETRKAIIELIEPYMNKQVTKGCIIERMWNLYETIWWRHFISLQNWKYIKSQKNPIETMSFNVIWHYDITAVVKYCITKRKAEISVLLNTVHINCPELQECFIIPNKPLHLYTEEEDENLLKLLKTL